MNGIRFRGLKVIIGVGKVMGDIIRRSQIYLLIFIVIIGVSIGPFVIQPSNGKKVRDGSLAVWEDDFFDGSKIDISLSHHYILDTENGTVSMKNTYAVWTDPSFTRMKPIMVTNAGGQTFYNYVVELLVYYDTDMQPDFEDLRFVNGQGTWLSYWIEEFITQESAAVLVLVPEIPAGSTIPLYMFYGNPQAEDESDFDALFTWQDQTDPDIMISFKAVEEGAWDPDVAYGSSRFLVAWEERVGPEDLPLDMQRTLPCVIHGRTYNVDGGDPYPEGNDDINISDPESSDYHAENPSIAFGNGRFFVVWEQNPADIIDDRYEADIMGAWVYPDGSVNGPFIICQISGGQFDPHVAYDSDSNRFFVVWEDAHEGFDNYDIDGVIYSGSGSKLTNFDVSSNPSYSETEPWVCSDHMGNILVVYEKSYDPVNGPFSLNAKRFDDWGCEIGLTITIAQASSNVDYIFPAVNFNTVTQQYFVTWNDGDISEDPEELDSYNGNIWGKLLNINGETMVDNFIVQSGETYIRADVVPFFNTMFFVSYDGRVGSHRDIWGKLVSSEGQIVTDELQISDGSSLNVDWNNLAIGEERIFVTWEDERDVVSQYADAFGNVWKIHQSIGSPDISVEIGFEKELITEAVLTSKVISPDEEEFVAWHEFNALYETPTGAIQFDIIDEEGTEVILEGIDPFEDLSNISELAFRLRSTFTRTVPSDTPVLDKWNVSWYMWNDTQPPWTEIELEPQEPDGEHDWYVTPITFFLTAHDNDTAPENVTTYYSINGEEPTVYNPENPPIIASERPDNWVEFWSIDSAENEEYPHNIVENIKLDQSIPSVTIYKPPELVFPGTVIINISAIEYASGSGVERLIIQINDDELIDTYIGSHSVWFEWNFTAELGEIYDLHVIAYDTAGNDGHDRREIRVSEDGVYEPGFIYLFDNPKIGPRTLLERLDLAIKIDTGELFILLPDADKNTSMVEFVAKQHFLEREYSIKDTNLSDGCFGTLDLPIGIYELQAYEYDKDNQQLAGHVLISKIFVLLL